MIPALIAFVSLVVALNIAENRRRARLTLWQRAVEDATPDRNPGDW